MYYVLNDHINTNSKNSKMKHPVYNHENMIFLDLYFVCTLGKYFYVMFKHH